LAHVTLIGAIESEFNITIDIADSLELTSFEAIIVYLEERPS
jgi:acyl carrier protein